MHSCTAFVLNGFSFRSSVAFCADNPETLVSCRRCLRNFWGKCSSLAPVSSNFSSMSPQWCDSCLCAVTTLPVFIYIPMNSFSVWNCNILKFALETCPYFSCRSTSHVSHMNTEYLLLQHVYHMWNLNMG